MTRGTVGIGTVLGNFPVNFGTLVRAARCFGADFVFTVNGEYDGGDPAVGHDKHIPCFHYDDLTDFRHGIPKDSYIIRVDYDDSATRLSGFHHPEKVVYLLGSEGDGFNRVDDPPGTPVYINTEYCLNTGMAGNIVLYDRMMKQTKPEVDFNAIL